LKENFKNTIERINERINQYSEGVDPKLGRKKPVPRLRLENVATSHP
jgi:hypothetical protein